MSDERSRSDEELAGISSFLLNHRRHHPEAEIDWAWVEAVAEFTLAIPSAKGKPGRRKSETGYAAEDVEIFRKKYGWTQQEARRAVAQWRKMDYDSVAEAHRRILREARKKARKG